MKKVLVTPADGANEERKAFRKYLKRKEAEESDALCSLMYGEILAWVNSRTKRYQKKSGGLGK